MTAPVLVVGPIEPPIGGVSRYCRSVAEILTRSGVEAIQIDPERPSANGRGPLTSLLGRALIGRATPEVRRAKRRHHAGLVLDSQQTFWRDPAYARGVRLCLGSPYVLVIHDGAFPDFVTGLGGRSRRRLSRSLATLSSVFCMSEEILAAVQTISPGASARRTIPLLALPAAPKIGFPAELERFLGSGDPVISASGALHPQYGLEELCEAFGELRRRGSRARLLVLLGSFVEERSTAETLAAAQGRHGRDALMMLSDFPDGSAVIARTNLYVRPSRVDSFGMALHEARLAGVPVVASEHPTRPEGILLYRPGDSGALARALEDGLGPEAAATARARAVRLGEEIERSRKETLEVLTALAAAAPL